MKRSSTRRRGVRRAAVATLVAAIVLAAALVATAHLTAPAGAGGANVTRTWSPLWAVPFTGPSGKDDIGQAIARAPGGSLYVAGVANQDPAASTTTGDILLVKYNATGAQQWSVTYDGDGHSFDMAIAVAVAPSGDVVVLGRTTTAGGHIAFVTLDYAATGGGPVWAKTYAGPGTPMADCRPADLAVDKAGNVYVAGAVPVAGHRLDAAIVKYSGGGTRKWARLYDGPGHHDDTLYGIGLDAKGNIYTAGVTRSDINRGANWLVMRSSPAGKCQWVRTYNGPAHRNDYAHDVAVTGAGAVYVVGAADRGATKQDAVISQWTAGGRFVWRAWYAGSKKLNDAFYYVTRAPKGRVAATGGLSLGSADSDVLTVEWPAKGRSLWTQVFDGSANGIDGSTGIAADAAGNIYVCGHTEVTGQGWDDLVLKYGPGGGTPWGLYGRTWDGAASLTDETRAIVVMPAGPVVTGTTTTAGGDRDAETVAFPAN